VYCLVQRPCLFVLHYSIFVTEQINDDDDDDDDKCSNDGTLQQRQRQRWNY